MRRDAIARIKKSKHVKGNIGGATMELMENPQVAKHEAQALYDKIQLTRLNTHAFESGIIDEQTKTAVYNKIWSS